MSALAELFPDGEYRFHLTLRRGEPAEFFRTLDASGRTRAERARWIAEDPNRYVALAPEGTALAQEFCEMLAGWELLPAVARESAVHETGVGLVAEIGAAVEPDVLLLAADDAGKFRLRGGALCFPTGWALEEKMGHPMDFIHGVVPGLNAALGSPIQQFLGRLKPGLAYLRDNWGLAATDELNLHPVRRLPPPAPPVALDRLWLRVEHQALLALPRTGGIVFGIRIVLHRLDAVARDPAAAAGLRRALETMPDDLAAYKRLDGIQAGVIRAL